MTRKPASRETLERLAEAAVAYHDRDERWDELKAAMQAYRAETTPPLRTRAEVDAEIVVLVRGSVDAGPAFDCLSDDGNSYTPLLLRKLCAEPTAPEGETGPPCHQCGRPMAPMTSVLPGGAWLCHCRAETNQG